MKDIKYLEKIEIIPFDLSSGGSLGFDQDFDLESNFELELLFSKPRIWSRTFSLNHLSRVWLGR